MRWTFFSYVSKTFLPLYNSAKIIKIDPDFSKVMITNVLPPFFMVHSVYNAKTWTTTADIQRRLRTFEMSCLRRILGVTRLACMHDADVMDKLNVKQDIVQRLQTRRLRFFGHVVRMPPERLPYIALHGRADGQRPRGRPRKRWLDGEQEDCRDGGMSLIEAFRFAEDRTTWRSILGLSECVHTSP